MSSDLDKKLCQKHKLEILTIDLKQSTADEDKYLCIKCLMEKIDIQNMALVEETKTMIKQMKSEQLTFKIKEYQRRIEIFKQIQSQVKELKLSINNTIDKVQSNLDQKITLMENELDESESKTFVSTFEEDIRILSKNYKGSFSFEVPKEFEKSIDDNSYIDQIQQQLQSIINCPKLIQIKESLEKTKAENGNSEVKQIQLLNKQEEDPQKTPSLKIQCNKHGKEIIMFNLNPEKTQFSRLACVECIQSNDPIKYTTLEDANFKWNEYRGQTSDQVKRFQNSRYLQSSQIIEILQDIKEKYNSTISEIINKINTQYSMFSQNETNEFNDNMIFLMNTEQINELTEILSQNDKFKALAEKQFNIQKEDFNQLVLISTNFGQLLQNDLLATQKINKIFKDSSLNISNVKDQTDDIVQDDNNSIQNLQQIKQLNQQLQHFKLYQNILDEALNQYDLIMQTISSLSNQFKDVQQQQFNHYVSKIEKDLSLMQKFTQFDQVATEHKLLKQEKEQLQNQLIESEKSNLENQLVINDFKKHDAEQIKQISDLRNQNQGLLVQIKELGQQKTQCELILKEKQAELQICQQSNQKNEQMMKQLQQNLKQEWQFSQFLTFSTTYKHSSCSVTQNGKVIENSSGGYYCYMCDQMIPKNGVIQFAIKIIEINSIMIGIGFRDIVQSKGYQSCYSIGGGTYNIYSSGYCYNHDQQDKNDKKIAFEFQKNDIIIVEVDIQKKYIKWTKQSTNESFTLTIDTSKDLYPCVKVILNRYFSILEIIHLRKNKNNKILRRQLKKLLNFIYFSISLEYHKSFNSKICQFSFFL
ncbi:unnamed protein product [Paramecium pentaurelia]|uniref:Uncharacterized protein n=1 Tax=Paramecium pentaurelia TaxID=43138 RepID=A0A8S1VUE3_9CILI|nr:unnamed protein product [Paramecium pentaurelia]